jgi:hypothetical protein
MFCFVTLNCFSQSFVNGDLDGLVSGSGSLPTDWLNVPNGDPNCMCIAGDSPDLTSVNGPGWIAVGAIGNPFSGNTFISGLFVDATSSFSQEGIMQTVSGFTIGNEYSIRIRQTVVKQSNTIDNSGSWAVYIDTVLAGITIPTYSNEPFSSFSMPWELRTVGFTATQSAHLIKFLPMDDDTNNFISFTDTAGALRMGIDSIGLEVLTSINEQTQNKFSLFPNPNNGNFRLQFKSFIDKPMKLTITDIYGELIDVTIITNALTNYENINLKNGIYFYTIRQGIEEIGKGKILVLH